MSNDPRSYQSGGYDQTRPISPLPQSANQQVPPSSYNQQIPDYGLPGQNAFSQERNPVRKRGLNKVLVRRNSFGSGRYNCRWGGSDW